MLFQPTMITPDYLGTLGNGIVDPSESLTVSWLVNGNSAMTKFQIDFYYNDTASTLIYSTGLLTTGCPFYGIDAYGNKQFFSYTDSSIDLTTTDEWKMVITQYWSDTDYVVQSSPSTFTVKSAPTLTLTDPGTVSTRDYTFTATYTQADGDALNWVRWQIAVDTDEGRESPLYDSGNIYGTALLECYYDGFFTGTSYCVNVSIETESGIQKETGWTTFAVEYTTDTLEGTVAATAASCGRSAVLVKWSGFRYIDGVASGSYSISDGLLDLDSGSSVTWDKANGSDMNIGTPWYILYKGKLQDESTTLLEVECESNTFKLYFTTTHSNASGRALIWTDGSTNYVVSATINITTDATITLVIEPALVDLRIDYMGGGLYPSTTLYPNTSLYPAEDTEAKNYEDVTDIYVTQSAIKSVKIYGKQECDYIQIINSDSLDSSVIYNMMYNADYKPSASIAGTYFYADFVNSELNAGSLYVAGTEIDGWAVYRQQQDNQFLQHIADTEMETSAIYDYSACSGQGDYKYYVYPIGTKTYITSPLISNAVNPVMWNWSLLECTETADGEYAVENEFLFGKNLDSGSVSNNNSPNVLENFTRYPIVQLSPHNYRSGELSSLIGTACKGVYSDTLAQRDAIENLSTTTNTLFLKSRKGDLMEVRISDAISFSTMDDTREQALTVSLPWVQVGSGEDVSIIMPVS